MKRLSVQRARSLDTIVKYLVEFKKNKISLDFWFRFASRQNEKEKRILYFHTFFIAKKVSKTLELPTFILSYLFLRESLGTLPINIGIKQPRLLSLRLLLAFTIKIEMFMDMNLFSLFVIRCSLFVIRYSLFEKRFIKSVSKTDLFYF
jgi:hypothetical protein